MGIIDLKIMYFSIEGVCKSKAQWITGCQTGAEAYHSVIAASSRIEKIGNRTSAGIAAFVKVAHKKSIGICESARGRSLHDARRTYHKLIIIGTVNDKRAGAVID
jgi:hypothetical protein